ncbi:hypothetical protein N9T15_00075 [Pelagibacteraceae bacterium]|nr:hypothetical protein [Pelagibacteraceae bacterium]
MKLYYEKHIFFCTNLREDKNKVSCGVYDSTELRMYMKKKVKEAGIKGVWFYIKNKRDIDLLIEQFLLKDKIVNKLLV